MQFIHTQEQCLSTQGNPFRGEVVNDVHSQLNATLVRQRLTPCTTDELSAAVLEARQQNMQVCIAGGRHAMGGQQFCHGAILLDMTRMNRVLNFDRERGLIEVQAGILWPELVDYLCTVQSNAKAVWTIGQKQTGCDRLTIGGALAANVHGRGLAMKPFVNDVEEFTLVNAQGEVVKCSRTHNSELFALVIGGYGQFGVVASATLRLVARTLLRRHVEITDTSRLIVKLEQQIAAGATYGDFQFAIDDTSADFLRKGILSTYTPVSEGEFGPEQTKASSHKLLSVEDWKELLYLAHVNKEAAFNKYSRHYLSTNGQLYLSDTFQLATYIDGYHAELDKRLPGNCPGTELITELYVPRHSLAAFLDEAAKSIRKNNASVIYGTVRLIERDDETRLPWAKEGWACTVLNLHVDHTPEGMEKAKRAFRDLIDVAIKFGGSFYLTYHRFASKRQLLSCYPEMEAFIDEKTKHDPDGIFNSEWFDHIRNLFRSTGDT